VKAAVSLPPAFVARSRALLGDACVLLEDALLGDAPVSLRMNRGKSAEVPSEERVPWCDTGYYLADRPLFTFDPLFHAGAYYVQEASSMFLEQAVGRWVGEPVCCLDLCAAPGGKSTLLASLLPEGSLMVSNEVIRLRANILVENLTKWGCPHVVVTRCDPEVIGRLGAVFDLLVADVPCSGEGLFRRDPGSAERWSEGLVRLCAERQRRILRDVWGALKPGGICLYSTCTFNVEENEDNVAYLVETLGAEPLSVPFPEEWGVTGALKHGYPVCRFFPHRTRGEGFFLAAVRKTGGGGDGSPVRRAGRERAGFGKAFSSGGVPEGLLLHPERFCLERRGDWVTAIPLVRADVIRRLSEALHPVVSGLVLGEIKGRDFVPSHALAMSCELNRDAFPLISLSREDALRYLRRDALPIAGGKGYALVSYRDLPLGFVKRIGNRANNLYPPEWRIRCQG
jgi:16S rRNA C967 or C1407 C5-methylase (RsmB/RsmF family)/NOL1/NOP2/fmu family ribosome biogenesis protein